MDLDLGEHTAPAVLQALIKALAAKGILSDDDLNDLRSAHAEAAAQQARALATNNGILEAMKRNHPFRPFQEVPS